MARGEEKEVSIFNMSFLDVFCCTVGALVFILFIQILRTRDMVERQELENTVIKLTQAKEELGKTEKAKEEMQDDYKKLMDNIADAQAEKEKMEMELEVAIGKLEDVKKELEKKDDTIQKLVAELKKPQWFSATAFTC